MLNPISQGPAAMASPGITHRFLLELLRLVCAGLCASYFFRVPREDCAAVPPRPLILVMSFQFEMTFRPRSVMFSVKQQLVDVHLRAQSRATRTRNGQMYRPSLHPSCSYTTFYTFLSVSWPAEINRKIGSGVTERFCEIELCVLINVST